MDGGGGGEMRARFSVRGKRSRRCVVRWWGSKVADTSAVEYYKTLHVRKDVIVLRQLPSANKKRWSGPGDGWIIGPIEGGTGGGVSSRDEATEVRQHSISGNSLG